MPQLGVPELLIILVIVILVFGVGKLPKVGAAIGQSIRDFRNATHDLDSDDAGKATSQAREAEQDSKA